MRDFMNIAQLCVQNCDWVEAAKQQKIDSMFSIFHKKDMQLILYVPHATLQQQF